ncbi:MAG: hypothetical protein ACE14S_11665 [Candidatus Bathyarchaeia archaeon]
MDTTVYIPIIILIIAGLLSIVVAIIAVARNRTTRQTRFRSRHYRYVPGAFSAQMELDMRLPYRRFRQLYPTTRWTYEEYKRMQMQTAFRRSMSSQENKRMVR